MTKVKYVHSDDCRCLSWQPIMVGALVAIGLSFILNLFSVAIGLNSFTTTSEGAQNVIFGGLLGSAIGIIAVMFGAGWLTGYLSQRHCAKRHLGALYGFLAWSIALILIALLASPVQQYIEYYTSFISGSNGVRQMTAAAQVMNNPKDVVLSSYILFVLFFLSAFACSLGGHVGARHIAQD